MLIVAAARLGSASESRLTTGECGRPDPVERRRASRRLETRWLAHSVRAHRTNAVLRRQPSPAVTMRRRVASGWVTGELSVMNPLALRDAVAIVSVCQKLAFAVRALRGAGCSSSRDVVGPYLYDLTLEMLFHPASRSRNRGGGARVS